VSFRKFQSIVDLRRTTISLLKKSAPSPDVFETRMIDQLSVSLSERVPAWNLELSEDDRTNLQMKAVSPDLGEPQFLAATCLLLLDRFARPELGTDFQWEWEEFADLYRNASCTYRSTIMNGLDQARKHNLISEDVRPSSSDCIAKPKQDILPGLIALGRSLTREERAWIAEAERGNDVDKHLKSLDALLESSDCLYPRDEVWYPAEVIELVSYGDQNPGFVGCTAIVLINAIADNDMQGNADYRWKINRFAYDALGKPQRRVILDGFRYLYEVNQDWKPFWEEFAPERLPTNSFLPL